MAAPRLRAVRAVAAAAVAGLVLTACTGGGDDGGDAPGAAPAATRSSAPITVTYAHEQEFVSYNNNTAALATTANSVVLNQVLRGFWYTGPNGQVVPDTDFGSFQRVSNNPLTVRYTFAPRAVWSDGDPIDCDDAVLAWAANSGRWPTGRRDPLTNARIGAFDAVRPGAWSNAGRPDCADGDRSFTVTYKTVYADWPSMFGAGSILPAHVVEKESGVKDVIAAVASDSARTMTKVGDIYDSLWLFRPGRYKTDVSPSAGPYQVDGWEAGRSITLRTNPRWWGRPPRASTVVIRFIPADRQVAALRSGRVQVIDPVPTTELLAQLSDSPAGARPLKVSMHDSFTWEHLDFNFSGTFKSKAMRKAFAECVPRQQIVDNLVKPQNPAAQVLQSRFLLPFQAGYPALTRLGGQDYVTADVAAARRILEAQGKVGTRVRIAYQAPNPRRKAEVDLIRESCNQAGFKVVDAGSEAFFGGDLNRGDFDLALFAWTGSQLLTQSYATYVTGGSENKGRYSSDEVDMLLRQLYSEVNPVSQQRLLAGLDTALWADLATMPLFAFPALVASVDGMRGVQYNPGIGGVTFNVDEWSTG